jgi:hypothetical protein
MSVFWFARWVHEGRPWWQNAGPEAAAPNGGAGCGGGAVASGWTAPETAEAPVKGVRGRSRKGQAKLVLRRALARAGIADAAN